MKRLLEGEGIPIAFCHNDLLLGNIIYNNKTSKVSFIDFEYAMPNYVAFDVANHFNEFAGKTNLLVPISLSIYKYIYIYI